MVGQTNRRIGYTSRRIAIAESPFNRAAGFSEQQREVDDGCADPVVLEYAMSKVFAVLGSALFFVIAPLVLAGFVPWWVTQWEFRPAFFGLDLTRILGGILIIVGVPGLVDSFARFALEGLGTPAPDRAATKARSDWPLSLRAKSDLDRGRRSHFWSGPFVW